MITEPTYANYPTSESLASGSVVGHELTELPSIEFRVIRNGSPARRMRLNTTRCTLGSGEGCTVRLSDATLRPMHAVILRDANRVLLRAYTVPIEVNGFLTGETFLRFGDIFTLGSYQFELISDFDVEARSPLDARTVPRRTGQQATPDWATPRRAAELTVSDRFQVDAVVATKPTRLSFLGGGKYVSEAFQALPLQPIRPDSEDASTRTSQREEAEQLRREVDAWRQREQHWQEQEAHTRAELADAVARFHQSQERAKEAAESVSQMRLRMSQLTTEVESLANDLIEVRFQASQRQETMRQATDAAGEAREIALQQREDAQRQRDELLQSYDEAIRQRDEATRQRDEATRQRDEATQRRDEATQLRDEATRQCSERDAAQNKLVQELDAVCRHRELVAAQLTDALQQLDEINRQREQAIAEREQVIAERELADQQYPGTHPTSDIDQQANATFALQQTQQEIASLTRDLVEAGDQLRIAKEEVTTAYARMEELSADVRGYREQLDRRDQSLDEQSTHYESLLEQLRTQVQRLQVECTEAREHAASAANDRHLAESLQSRLSMTESQRHSDRRSWEQEATSLHETVQQLSCELATASGRLSQTQLDHEATQAELNDAYERLTVARRELAARPTCQQWDDLQNQLAETEEVLEETERQLTALRSDYDELLGRQPRQAVASEAGVSSASVSHSVSSTPSVERANDAVSTAIGNPTSSTSESQPNAGAEPADIGWPTYQIHSDDSSLPASGDGEVDPEQERWAADAAEVADRLRSYTSHDEARHGVPESAFKVELGAGDKTFDAPPSSELSSGLAASPATTPELPATAANIVDQQNHSDVDGDSSIGLIARKLIAQLGEASARDDQTKREASLDDANEAWASSPLVWRQSDADVADGQLTADVDQDPLTSQTQAIYPTHANAELEIQADRGALSATDPTDDEADLGQDEASSDDSDSATLTGTDATSVDDDSIEAYMNRLLQRVQGHSSTPATPVTTSKPTVKANQKGTATPVTTETKSRKANESAVASEVPEPIDYNTPLVPRSQAPEDAGNMAAMRELANATANSAISVSVRSQAQQLKSRAIIDILQAGVVMICAFAFYTCGIKIPNLQYVWHTAAALAAALSMFFVIDMLKKLAAAKATYDRADGQAKESSAD